MADGQNPLNTAQIREGLVFRMKNVDRKVSFKTISNEYLLKYGL